MGWLLCTLPLARKVPGPDRVRVLPAWISTIRSPAASVSLSLAFSLAPAGYLLADGPVERTTIDWAAAVPARATAATAATDARARRRIVRSGQDIAFSSFGLVQAFQQEQDGWVIAKFFEHRCGAGHKGRTFFAIGLGSAPGRE